MNCLIPLMFAVVTVAIILGPRLTHAFSYPTHNQLLILGLGRVGREVARQAYDSKKFVNIAGTVRQDECGAENGTQIIPFENRDAILQTARLCRYLLITIPPSKDEVENVTTIHMVQSVLKELQGYCWIGVISTTGVYGNHAGKWVTEQTACQSVSSTAVRYLAYEDGWKEKAKHHSLRIFRCAGIYGPDQSALHTVFDNGLLRGNDLSDTADLTNRVHVYDLATAIIASMNMHNTENNSDFQVYNLADDLPESRAVVMAFAAQLLQIIGVPIREALSMTQGSRARRRKTDSKRVSNQKMKQLVCALKYPTYKEGLANILQHRPNPWW